MLNRLVITPGASYHPEKVCLEGTRIDILNNIRTWYRNDGCDRNTRIALITGQVGTGKSAIMHTIAHECRAAGRLGGFYAFSKDRGPENLFRTIARSLADIESSYRTLLAKSINTEIATTQSISLQFNELLCNPLRGLTLSGPVVIIIDALDECASQRQQVIQCLTERAQELPENICFLVSSRATEAAALRHYNTVQVFDLEAESQATTTKDIALFVEHRLTHSSSGNPFSGFHSEDFQSLAMSSEGLFQYAAVVCEEVVSADTNMDESPKGAFNRLVKARNGLDSLYKVILRHAYRLNDQPSRAEERLEKFRRVVGWILNAKIRLTQKAWMDFGLMSSSLRGSNELEPEGFDAVSNVLRPLGALLSGTHSNSDTTVYPAHSSFGEYLLDSNRSGIFYVGLEVDLESNYPAHFASVCLAIMDRDLRFNMAGLESSYAPNSEVPDFEAKARNGVSEALAYSCCYWTEHILQSEVAENALEYEFRQIISKLIGPNFLLWMEALALQKSTAHANTALVFLSKWLSDKVRSAEF